MKKYIIAAATIMAINNSPTFAHGEVTTGQARTDNELSADKGAELRSANEKEQDPEINQAQGQDRGSPEMPFAQRVRNSVQEHEAEISNEKFLKWVEFHDPDAEPRSNKEYYAT